MVYNKKKQNIYSKSSYNNKKNNFQFKWNVKTSFTEMIMRKFLSIKYPDKIFYYNARPKRLYNPKTNEPLEMDIYCPELKCCREIQWLQHYKDQYQVEKDKIKKNILNKKNITVCNITPKQLEMKLRKLTNDWKYKNSKYYKLYKSMNTFIKNQKEKYNDATIRRRKPKKINYKK